MALFGTKKGVNPHTRYPDAYYGRVFFDKPMFDGIKLVAKIERRTKKKAARLLIERGFINYVSEKLKEAIKVEIAAEELRQKPKANRFIRELRKFAAERGIDISKFIWQHRNLAESLFHRLPIPIAESRIRITFSLDLT
jgi:uridine kinase